MTLRRGVFIIIWASVSLLTRQRLSAEPSFARKYHTDCTLCHTVYPRLNRTGYEFRRHGYRFITAPVSVPRPEPREAPVSRPEPREAPVSRDGAAETQGRRLITQLNCQGCHSVGGRGGRTGPSLDGVALRRPADYIAEQITNPGRHNPSTVMPPAQVNRDQLHAIVAFLTGLPAPGKSEEHAREPLILDYVAATWTPAIRLSQSSGAVDASYDTRELTLFAAGTLGSHMSMFIESNPTTEQTGFAQQWGEAQGVFNSGAAVNYTQIRAGQLLALQGSGFGATDRVFSDSNPLIYNPVNGFAAARYVRGASAEYTFGENATLKIFGGESSDHSRSNGAIFEQVIGRKGLSGFTVEFADGWNPLLRNGPSLPELRFRRLLLAGNKTFGDSRNRERVNLVGAVMMGFDNHLVGGDPNRTNHSYGSYVELDTVPVPRHIGTYLRFDQLRPATQQTGSIYAGTAGMTLDVTHYARLLLEYQRFDHSGGSNFYSIGFRLNF